MDTKRFVVYAMVMVALALAGCGGNGGGTAMMPPPTEPEPMTPTPVAVNLAAVETYKAVYSTAEVSLGTIPATGLEFTLQPGGMRDVGDVKFTCGAGMACTITIRRVAQAAVDAEGNMLTITATGAVTVGPSAEAMRERMAFDAGQTATREARAMGIVTANDREHSPTDPAPYDDPKRPGKALTGPENARVRSGDVVLLGSLGTVDGTDNRNTERVKRDGTIGDVSIANVAGNTDPTMETFTNPRPLTMTDAVAPSVGSFASGSVHSLKNDMGVTNTVTVYETRSAGVPQGFNEFYAPQEIQATGPIRSVFASPSTPTIQRYNSINFNSTLNLNNVADIKERFKADGFPSGAAQTYTYYPLTVTTIERNRGYVPYEDLLDPAETDRPGETFQGMFHGVPGTYTCSAQTTGFSTNIQLGTRCSATTDHEGNVVTLRGKWGFQPTEHPSSAPRYMIQGALPDTDYLTFGYWVQTEEDDGEVTIGVSTFASGTPLTSDYVTSLQFLEGSATYEGKAVGQFVRKTFMGDRGLATITHAGAFTADANLTAHFGGTAISFNDSFTIRGTIDNFRNGDGNMIDSNWSVTLGSASFGSDLDNTGPKEVTTATFAGETTAGGSPGTWGGSFYGDSPANLPAAGTGIGGRENSEEYPTSVAGEFDAHFVNGHVLGAFGAERPGAAR